MADTNPAVRGKKKLDPASITTIGQLIIGGAKVVQEVWDALDKDDRVSNQVRELATKMRHGRSQRTPAARLRATLDEIETYATSAATDPKKAEHATDWLARAQQIRAKVPLVETLTGPAKAKHLRQLKKQTTALFGDIIATDLADGVD